MKTHLFLEEIITCSIELFTVFESDMAVEIRTIGKPTRVNAETNIIVQQNAAS